MTLKEQIIQAIEKCIITEESAVPVFTKHIQNTLFLSGFREEDQERVIRIMTVLSNDSQRHKKAFEGLLAKVRETYPDV